MYFCLPIVYELSTKLKFNEISRNERIAKYAYSVFFILLYFSVLAHTKLYTPINNNTFYCAYYLSY